MANEHGAPFLFAQQSQLPYLAPMKRSSLFLPFFASLVAAALPATAVHHDTGEVNKHMHRHDFDKLVSHFEDPERADWQKPDTVIAALGALPGKTVADIGAGTGYFAFPIASQAAKVIAIDIDQRMLDFMEDKKTEQSVGDNLETRITTPDSPGLADGEADLVLIVNTYHHIENRVTYLGKVAQGMSEEARLVIVDFFKRELPVGPPPRMKLTPDEVAAELSEAGFENVTTEAASLDHQYIVTATRPDS